MLDEREESIIEAARVMTAFHRNNEVPVDTPAWINISVAAQTVEMEYGFMDTPKGRLRFKRGQFELTHVTNAQGNWVELAGYNHQGNNTTRQNFYTALKCENLNRNPTHASAIIIMTSECCRSIMVRNAICTLMRDDRPFNLSVQSGMNFAYTNYSKTCKFMGYNIQAGGDRWDPLLSDYYRAYIASADYTGARILQTAYIDAVEAYIGIE